MNIRPVVTAVLSSLVLLAIVVTIPAKASIISFSSIINGAQANAGAGSGSLATGSAAMFFNDFNNEFSWSIGWTVLSGPVVAAHFHGAALPSQNAGVQIDILGIASDNQSIGKTVINNDQLADLQAGFWYINIHTVASPAGEIRGQVLVVPQSTPVPEPTSLALFGLGLVGLSFARRKRMQNNPII